MFDSLGADENVRHSTNLARPPPNHQHFEAVVVIQVNMKRRKDRVMVVMLDGSEFLAQLADVMVVDQGDGSDHMTVGRFPGFLHEFVANQIAKRFRPVGVATLPD